MGARNDVSPSDDRINQQLDNDAYADFNTDYVGVDNDVLPGDIKNNIFENIPDCGIDYDWSVNYEIQY